MITTYYYGKPVAIIDALITPGGLSTFIEIITIITTFILLFRRIQENYAKQVSDMKADFKERLDASDKRQQRSLEALEQRLHKDLTGLKQDLDDVEEKLYDHVISGRAIEYPPDKQKKISDRRSSYYRDSTYTMRMGTNNSHIHNGSNSSNNKKDPMENGGVK